MEGTRRRAGGLVRIGVSTETAPHNWQALKRLSGMKSRMAKGLEATGSKLNSRPSEWFGTFETVPRQKWAAVEVYQDGQWVPTPFERDVIETQAALPKGE